MNRENAYDPDEAPRSALGSDDVSFEAPPQYRSAGSVQMNTPTPPKAYSPPSLVAAKPAATEPPFEWRKPTVAEEKAAFLELFYKINLHRVITLNHAAVVECLQRIDGYVGAHSDGNGERTEAEIQQNINRAFWQFMALDPTKGKKLVLPKEPVAEKPAVAVKRKPGRPRKNPLSTAPVRVRKVKKAEAKPAAEQIDGDVFQG